MPISVTEAATINEQAFQIVWEDGYLFGERDGRRRGAAAALAAFTFIALSGMLIRR